MKPKDLFLSKVIFYISNWTRIYILWIKEIALESISLNDIEKVIFSVIMNKNMFRAI